MSAVVNSLFSGVPCMARGAALMLGEKMIECYFGIASYRRPDYQRTIEYLRNIGVEKERIILSVQTEEDLASYTEAGWGTKVGQIIYRPGNSASDNRNNILDNIPMGARVVLMDDDIKAINRLRKDKLQSISNCDELEMLLRCGFGLAAKHRTAGWGIYPVNNAFFMHNGYDDKSVVTGVCIGLKNTGLRFNPEYTTKEDYEFCCKAIRTYGAFIRLNNYAGDALHYTKGGCEKQWNDGGEVRRTARRLVGTYPDILELNPKKPGEVRMVSKKKR